MTNDYGKCLSVFRIGKSKYNLKFYKYYKWYKLDVNEIFDIGFIIGHEES